MTPGRGRRIALLALPIAVFVVASLVAASTIFAYRTGGPLASSSTVELEWGLAPGEDGTWGMDLPANPTASDIRIDSVEPVAVSGLDVLGVLVSTPAEGESLVNALGFPPDGVATTDPGGVVLPALSGPQARQVLIGVRLQEDAELGSIQAIRVRYRVGDDGYETELPWGLRILPDSSG
jgi:hypothetical protein